MKNLRISVLKNNLSTDSSPIICGLLRRKQSVTDILSKWLVICLALCLASCSDDEPSVSITTQPTSSSFTDLNTCDVGGGGLATLFEFTIPFQATSAIEIAKITTDWERSGGNNGTNEETNFNNNGNTVVYDWCWRFDGDDWIDLTTRLITRQGIVSSPSIVRLNKPNGAN